MNENPMGLRNDSCKCRDVEQVNTDLVLRELWSLRKAPGTSIYFNTIHRL